MSRLIWFLLPAFVLAHGVPRAPFVEHLHAGGEQAHTHDLGAPALGRGLLGQTLAALAERAAGLHSHSHRHGSAEDHGGRRHTPAATGVSTATANEDVQISAQQRARFRARLAGIPGERARPRAVSRSVHPSAVKLSTRAEGSAWHRHPLSPFQLATLAQPATLVVARLRESPAPRPSWGLACAHQASLRARSPPLS